MTGGRVLESLDLQQQRAIWVSAWDATRRCEVFTYLRRTNVSRSISPGDALYWDEIVAYWAPRVGGKRQHIPRSFPLAAPDPARAREIL